MCYIFLPSISGFAAKESAVSFVICPERKELEGMFRVSEPEDLWYWNNEQTGETVCGILYAEEPDKP